MDDVQSALIHTLDDYKNPKNADPFHLKLKRLTDKGLIVQLVDSGTYPKISGTFTSTIEGDSRREWILQSIPGTDKVKGQATFLGRNYSSKSIAGAEGTVESNGALELIDDTFGWHKQRAIYSETAGKGQIQMLEDGRVYMGPATGETITVAWYTYSWQPEFSQRLVHRENHSSVVTGKAIVRDVSNLRLLDPTEASATYTYTVDLNDDGNTFMNKKTPEGKTTAHFGKKPDGTWFFDSQM